MRAMIDPDQELLERTLRAARKVEAPSIDEDEARERVVRAVARARTITRRRNYAIAGVTALSVAAAFALVVWSALPTPSPPTASAEPTSSAPPSPPATESHEVSSVRLPSGDRLVAEPGAHYDVESTDLDRRVHLTRGEVRFDVASLDGGSFTVATSDVEVRVRGTVFSVRCEDHVEVVVFEGSVEVRHGNLRVVLGPGDRWSSADVVAEAGAMPRARTGQVSGRSDGTRRGSDPESTDGLVRLWRSPTSGLESRSERVGGRGTELTLDEARRLLLERDFDGALEACGERREAGWQMLRADALRGLRRWREAAEAYDAAIPLLVHARRAQAGYAAARLWSDQADDPQAALASIRSSHAASIGSPLEERARALEIELLRRLGRDHRAQVQEYLERFPHAASVERP